MHLRCILVLVAFAALACSQEPAPLRLRAGTVLAVRQPVGDFNLVDHRAAPFGPAELRGRWSLLFTGFTNCPDICPMTLAMLAELRARLPDDAVQFLFVSVDPERDTPAVLSAYVAHFGPRLTGVTGTRAEVEAFTARLGLAQVRNPGIDGDYTVDHSTALILIDPQARVAAYFTAPQDIGALAADLASINGRST